MLLKITFKDCRFTNFCDCELGNFRSLMLNRKQIVSECVGKHDFSVLSIFSLRHDDVNITLMPDQSYGSGLRLTGSGGKKLDPLPDPDPLEKSGSVSNSTPLKDRIRNRPLRNPLYGPKSLEKTGCDPELISKSVQIRNRPNFLKVKIALSFLIYFTWCE